MREGIGDVRGGRLDRAVPADQPVQVGIIEPDGTKYLAAGSGTIRRSFYVHEDGACQIFVENQGDEPVDIVGMYQLLETKWVLNEIPDQEMTTEEIPGLGDNLEGMYLFSAAEEDTAILYALKHHWLDEGISMTDVASGKSQGYICRQYTNKDDTEYLLSFENLVDAETTRVSIDARLEWTELVIEITREKVDLEAEKRNVVNAHFSSEWGFYDVRLIVDGKEVDHWGGRDLE